MSEDIKLEVLKKTQDLLGKYFKKPPLTEKLLRKPPFRFIQDIVSAIIKETGFLEGLFTEEELSVSISKDKEAKLAFLTKLIDTVKLITGINLTVRATKIISGQEPAKTNELLQAIGRALDKKVSSKEAIIHYKNRSENKSDVEKSVSKEHSSRKLVSNVPAPSARASKTEQRVNEPEKKKTRKFRLQERKTKDKVNEEKTLIEPEVELDNSGETSNKKAEQHADQVPSGKKIDDISVNRPSYSKIEETPDPTNGHVDIVNKPQKSHPESVATKSDEPIKKTGEDKNQIQELLKLDPVRRTDSAKHSVSIKRIESGKYIESKKHKSESIAILQNLVPQENTILAKVHGSNFIDVSENTSGVANIIVEKSEKKEEAENMVIIEANKGYMFEPVDKSKNNMTEEHGCLVAQILKTEQELVNTNNVDAPNRKVEIVWQTGVVRNHESAMKTVSKLRNSIQTLIQFTNPLGKVLDYLQGDMEIMRKELMDYRNQYTAVNKLLENERMQTDKLMLHMKESLEDIDSNMYNQLNKIHQVKINISKNEHQIQRLLNDSA